MTEVAEYLGVTKASVAITKLPEPDAYVGKARGWKKSTIEEWAKTRRVRRKKDPSQDHS